GVKSAARAERSAAAPPEGRPRSIKRLLPDDFGPTAEHATIARESGVDLIEEFAKMRDWANSNAERKADWNATFRNWLRRATPKSSPRARQSSERQDAMRWLLEQARAGEQ